MTRWERLLIIIVPIIILGAICLRLSTYLEFYKYTDNKGYSRRAQEDRFLALRRWAGMNGIDLEEKQTNDIDNYNSILLNGSLLEDPIFAIKLRIWMENGGHLTLFITPRGQTEPDFSLIENMTAELGLEVSFEFNPAAEWQWTKDNTGELQGIGTDEPAVTVSPALLIIAEQLPPEAAFVPYSDEDEEGYRLISFPVEAGRLTLTGDPLFLQNKYIGESDNASLAWMLIASSKETGRVLFQPEGKVAGLIATHPWVTAVLAALLTALALAAWMGLTRRDTLLEAKRPAGSDIGRRLKAEGSFFRSYGCTETYLVACRSDALRRLRRRGFANGEGHIDMKGLSQKLRQDPAALKRAFSGEFPKKSKEFIEMMRIFHDIKEVI